MESKQPNFKTPPEDIEKYENKRKKNNNKFHQASSR